MNEHFFKVKEYLQELRFNIINESEEDQVLVVSYKESGINNMVIACANPLLIMEQFIFEVSTNKPEVYKQLLQKNRDIIHGAFVLDETGTKVLFRDTLQIENLDLNEIEASLNSLSLLLSEYSDELIKFSN